MHVVVGIVAVLIAGYVFMRGVARAREAGQQQAAGRVPGGKRGRGGVLPAVQRPIRHEIKRIWTETQAADWLKQRDHERARAVTAADNGSGAPFAGKVRSVPGHHAEPDGRARKAVVGALGATGAWKLLPGRAQGALCGCAQCRGTTPHPPPKAAVPSAPAPPPAPPRPAPASANGSSGRTTTVASSTGSAEKLIEGVNQVQAETAAGGIHAKHGGIKSCTEGSIRFSAMAGMMSRAMSEPGANYGPEITEPLAKASTHLQAAAMAFSESDAALTTLLAMSVGDLASSARQAPNHTELSESGSH